MTTNAEEANNSEILRAVQSVHNNSTRSQQICTSSVVLGPGRRKKSCSTGLGVRSYTAILGRRPIHTPKKNRTPAESSPKTPKSSKMSKERQKLERTPMQSTPKRVRVEPERKTPQSAARRKLLMEPKVGPVTRRRSLYVRQSPRVEAKATAEEEQQQTEEIINELPELEAPKEEDPESIPPIIDVSIAAFRSRNFCGEQSSSTTARIRQETSMIEVPSPEESVPAADRINTITTVLSEQPNTPESNLLANETQFESDFDINESTLVPEEVSLAESEDSDHREEETTNEDQELSQDVIAKKRACFLM